MKLSCLAIVVLLVASVPSEAAAQRGEKKCTPEVVEAAHTMNGEVFRDCDVTKRASIKAEPRVEARYGELSCVVAEVEFVVDSTGRADTSLVMVIVDANSQDFARALLQHVRRIEFKPAIKDGVAVRQVMRLRRGFETKKSFVIGGVGSDGRMPATAIPRPGHQGEIQGTPVTRCRPGG